MPRFLAAAVAVAATALALAQSALAATPPAGAVGPATPETTWQGMFYAVGTVSDPALCPPKALDPIDLICDHFELTVNGNGPVVVRIDWDDPSNDFDLFVYDAANNEVASSQNFETTFEETTFTATAGAVYEVRVIPFFVIASDYRGRARFEGAADGGETGGGGGNIDPPVWISDTRIVEGDSGMKEAQFTLTMGWETIAPATVNYQTADGTAAAGADYLPKAGEAVFAPGTTRTTVTVPILGDFVNELNESFTVRLFIGTPAVVKIYDDTGIATIRDDDWRRYVRGSGTTTSNGRFSVWVGENKWGRVSYSGNGARFYTSRIDTAVFTDLARNAKVTGAGWNNGRSVTFTLELTDAAPGGALDGFVLALSDGTRLTGPLASGDLEYQG